MIKTSSPVKLHCTIMTLNHDIIHKQIQPKIGILANITSHLLKILNFKMICKENLEQDKDQSQIS